MSQRLIDANALLYIAQLIYGRGYDGGGVMLEAIKSALTIDPVHAAGGCYCRECKSANPREDTGKDIYECPQNGVTVFCCGGHFCGYGERRE